VIVVTKSLKIGPVNREVSTEEDIFCVANCCSEGSKGESVL